MARFVIWLISFALLCSVASAALIITEPASSTVVAFNVRPLVQWSGCQEPTYLLTVATDQSFQNPYLQKNTSEPFFQLTSDLTPDTYYLLVQSVDAQGNITCTSSVSNYTVKKTTPLSLSFQEIDYASTNQVQVTVSGPENAKVDIKISSQGFFLPVSLDDLSDPSFTTLLQPGTYSFVATSEYLDGNLSFQQSLSFPLQASVSSQSSQNSITFSVVVSDFEGDPLDDAVVRVESANTNLTIDINKSGEGSVSLLKGTYNVSVSKEGYTPKRKELILDADRNYTFIIIPVDTLPEESASETGETELNDSRDQVFLAPLEKAVYSSSYIPLVFEFQGSAKRCQVLKKDASTSGYEIIHTLLDVKQTNEVILTDLPEGQYDLRVRCIISSDEAVVSTTQRVTTIDIDDNVEAVQSLLDSSQEVIEKINSFPSSFKQAFIEDIVSLEEVVVQSKKLLAQAKSAEDVEETSRLMKLLLENSSKSIIEQVTVESSEDSITYASLDDASLVTEYLDLSKDPSRLWEEQEQFAIKINYNFVTLSYLSGLSKKETFVSAQVIPVQGVDFDADYDLYFIMPSFLLSRLAESNDVVSKRYEEASLVRILENSSALIFDGWLDDTTLVRAVVLADDVSLGNKVTGRAVSLSSLPEWKIPLFSFIIILVLAGLFFNPYYSIIDLLQQNPMASFTSQVHECIDAMLSKEYARTVEMIPKVLDTHQKLSSEQKSQVTGIMKKIEELFYESSYHLAFQKIRLKPSHLWSFEELEVAIKDFYASYNMLSPQKQKENLPHFNQMLFKAQELLSQVKR